MLQIGENLYLRREGVRPRGVGFERKRVEVGRDVASRSGVRILAPGPANASTRLVDRERIEAHPLQADGHADAGETAANDRDARRTGRWVKRHAVDSAVVAPATAR